MPGSTPAPLTRRIVGLAASVRRLRDDPPRSTAGVRAHRSPRAPRTTVACVRVWRRRAGLRGGAAGAPDACRGGMGLGRRPCRRVPSERPDDRHCLEALAAAAGRPWAGGDAGRDRGSPSVAVAARPGRAERHRRAWRLRCQRRMPDGQLMRGSMWRSSAGRGWRRPPEWADADRSLVRRIPTRGYPSTAPFRSRSPPRPAHSRSTPPWPCACRRCSCEPFARTRRTPRCRATGCWCGPDTSAGSPRGSTPGCPSGSRSCAASSRSSARRWTRSAPRSCCSPPCCRASPTRRAAAGPSTATTSSGSRTARTPTTSSVPPTRSCSPSRSRTCTRPTRTCRSRSTRSRTSTATRPVRVRGSCAAASSS